MAAKERSGLQGRVGRQLGDELLAYVFAFLQPRDLAAVEATCWQWRRVCDTHKQLWRTHCKALLPPSEILAVAAAAGSGEDKDSPRRVEPTLWKSAYMEHKMAERWRHGRASVRFLEGHSGAVLCCSAWGTTMASGSADKTVRLWDLERGISTATLKHSAAVAWVLQLGPDLTATAAGTAAWLWRGGRSLRSFAGQAGLGDMRALAALQSDTWLATAGGCEVRLWDLYSGATTALLRPHGTSGASCLAAAEMLGQRVLLSGGPDGRVCLCDTASGGGAAVVAEFPPPGVASRSGLYGRGIRSLAVAPPRAPWSVIAAEHSGRLVCWDARMLGPSRDGGRLWTAHSGPDGVPSAVCVPPFGGAVATAGWAGRLSLWDVDSGRLIRRASPPPRPLAPASKAAAATARREAPLAPMGDGGRVQDRPNAVGQAHREGACPETKAPASPLSSSSRQEVARLTPRTWATASPAKCMAVGPGALVMGRADHMLTVWRFGSGE